MVFVGGSAMTQPVNAGDIQKRPDGADKKDDFDAPSDLCDFGYVLVIAANARPAPTAEPRRDDAD